MATIQQRGKSYYLQWSEGRQQRRISLGKITKGEALIHLRAKETELRSKGGISVAGQTLQMYAPEYLAWYSAEYPSSYDRIESAFRVHLIPYFGLDPIGAIERRKGEAYKHKRIKDGASAGTIEKEIRALLACINRAVEWDMIPRNPLKGLKPPQNENDAPPPFFEKPDIKLIYKSSLEDLNKARWQLMFNTGMRRGEALLLKKEWIDDQGIKILSVEGNRTKSRKWRLVPHNKGIKSALKVLSEIDGKFVLPQVNPKSFSRAFDNTLNRTGKKNDQGEWIKKPLSGSLHWTRHSYASHLVMKGEPLVKVQKLLGHASIKTTERYAHLSPDYMKSGNVISLNL